jgi:hypothetical protein
MQIQTQNCLNSLPIDYFDSIRHRPLPVTLISYLFIGAGTMSIIYHANELRGILVRQEVVWVLLVRLLAIVGGVFALRGVNRARWLLLAWIVYHVILSVSHSTAELAIHTILMIITAIALFHPKANVYFRNE